MTLRPSSKPSKKPAHKPTMAEELILGFIAGVLSRAVSTPLNMITLRLQAQGNDEDDSDEENGLELSRNGGVAAAAKSIYQQYGLFGFWRG
ncbi:hypothetical protein C0991_005053 [Blastosporella zonata]|nr:hypothetical protein C0991_005053 [Blastosporella zonata]